jgi:hypothetical protein
MIRRTTWILLAIFAVLVGFTWFTQKNQVNKATGTTTATPTSTKAYLFDIDSSQVSEVGIAASTGNQIGFAHDPETTQWAVSDLPADQADSFQIESVLAQLFSLQILETLTQTVPLDSVGLASPAYTITIKKTDGSQVVTHVGFETAVGSGYYVKADDGNVCIVSKVMMDDVLDTLTYPPILTTPTPEGALPTEIEPGGTPSQ